MLGCLVEHTLELEEFEVNRIRVLRNVLPEALSLRRLNSLDFQLTNFDLLIEQTLRSVQLLRRLQVLLQQIDRLVEPCLADSLSQCLHARIVRLSLQDFGHLLLTFAASLIALLLLSSLIFALFFLLDFLCFLQVLCHEFEHA